MPAAANNAGAVFGLIVVMVMLVLAFFVVRIVCASRAQLVGYWTSPAGDLFEVFPAARRGGAAHEYCVSTASGYMGAAADGAYPIRLRGCRTVSIHFPAGVLEGRVGFDRRRLIWGRAPTWYRQGV